MPPTRRQFQATRQRSERLRNESAAAIERAREVVHEVRNNAQRLANRRALRKAQEKKS